MWDLSILQVVPGLRLAAPRDAARLRAQLREAVEVSDVPTVLRYPKGSVAPDIEAVARIAGVDVLAGDADAPGDVLIVSVGAMAATALETAGKLTEAGVSATVVDPCWVKPVDPALVELATGYGLVAVIEDNGVVGGVGSAVAQAMREARLNVPVELFALPQRFLDHADRKELLAEAGLTPADISQTVITALARYSAASESGSA